MRTAIGPLGWGLWSAEELPSKKTELAGNPSEVNRAARLREILLARILAAAPSRGVTCK